MRDCVRMFVFALCSVSALAEASPRMPLHRRKQIAEVLLDYVKNSSHVINQPGRDDAVNNAVWLLVWACP